MLTGERQCRLSPVSVSGGNRPIADMQCNCNPVGMKPIVFAVTLLMLGCSPPAQGQQQGCLDKLGSAQPSEGHQPLVVLLESNPWAMVIGSDSPRLALYDDGLVIYRTDTGFKSVKLSEQEATKFKASLDVNGLACVLGHYDADVATDRPTETIFVGRGGKLSPISVYGVPKGPDVPAAMTSAYEKLIKFDHPAARTWLPEKVEVMVWPYEYAPEASINWPKEWPDLDSSDTVRRGDSYSIYLPAAEYPRLIDFLKGRNEKGAVEIGGKKWAADVRFPFPREVEWMKVIAEGN